MSDLPTWGHVALSMAIPIVESSGFRACSLPTALFSSHGGFPGFVQEGQTEFVRKSLAHLKALDVRFAGLLVGFIASPDQFVLAEEAAVWVRSTGGVVVVDPVMGDGGKRYSMISDDFVEGFRSLCSKADVITPNLTEAALLLGKAPSESPSDPRDLHDWALKLTAGQTCSVVITSAPSFRNLDEMAVVWRDPRRSKLSAIHHRRYGTYFPGAGDALAARLLVELVRNKSLDSAVRSAVRKTVRDAGLRA